MNLDIRLITIRQILDALTCLVGQTKRWRIIPLPAKRELERMHGALEDERNRLVRVWTLVDSAGTGV